MATPYAFHQQEIVRTSRTRHNGTQCNELCNSIFETPNAINQRVDFDLRLEFLNTANSLCLPQYPCPRLFRVSLFRIPIVKMRISLNLSLNLISDSEFSPLTANFHLLLQWPKLLPSAYYNCNSNLSWLLQGWNSMNSMTFLYELLAATWCRLWVSDKCTLVYFSTIEAQWIYIDL